MIGVILISAAVFIAAAAYFLIFSFLPTTERKVAITLRKMRKADRGGGAPPGPARMPWLHSPRPQTVLRARSQPRTRVGLRNGAGARAQADLRIQTSPVGFLARPLSGLIRLSPARREAVEKKLERAGSALCA
ncbi:MAG: hypothetical protein LBU58_11340, partial [Clostridiales bacterium]|nr:hypothetical protein [Clostridiales bacterium]